MPTYVNGVETRYVDRETGELITSTQEKTYSYKIPTDKFFIVYYEYILKTMTNIKSLKTFNLLIHLVSMADYNTGEVTISTYKRECLCKELEINTRNFTKYINELKDNNLISGARGSFIVNPKIFWKGDLKHRNTALKDKLFYVKFGFMDPDENSQEVDLKS